jgi:hypothetical protein
MTSTIQPPETVQLDSNATIRSAVENSEGDAWEGLLLQKKGVL